MSRISYYPGLLCRVAEISTTASKLVSLIFMKFNAVSRVPAVENHKTGGRLWFKGGYRV